MLGRKQDWQDRSKFMRRGKQEADNKNDNSPKESLLGFQISGWHILTRKQVKKEGIDFEDEVKKFTVMDATAQVVLTMLRIRLLGKRLWNLILELNPNAFRPKIVSSSHRVIDTKMSCQFPRKMRTSIPFTTPRVVSDSTQSRMKRRRSVFLFCSFHCRTVQACKVPNVHFGTKGIPYINTFDGLTIRYPYPLVKANNTIRLDLESNKINFIKFGIVIVVMVTGRRNRDRVGDNTGHEFANCFANVFNNGKGSKPWVTLPKGKGIKLIIIKEARELLAAQGSVTA
ncbi:hypothetical protein C5167_020105 [Papaver somniferum]|uniref:Uncharacterized protein n=1 Tax=Papaver somniferum TaxID=3469 RepID=A0A4Y7IVZ4_PAPSO|nr:hypothetical protein C5167_020105 [Papaver somniferum]